MTSQSDNPYLAVEAAGIRKEAGGLSVYLMEELGDARLNCQHLKQAIADAQSMVEKSSHRDHFYEVAGHLIDSVPKYLMKLEKSLDATALAAGKLDYEETKQGLRPEKLEELEAILKDVRLKALPRNSDPDTMSPKEAARRLEVLAGVVESGSTETILSPLLGMLHNLTGRGVKAGESKGIASLLRQAALEIEFGNNPKRSMVASRIREILSSVMPSDPSLVLAALLVGSSREKVIEGFKAANPALTDDQLEHIADQWERNKDVIKDKHSSTEKIRDKAEVRLSLMRDQIAAVRENLSELHEARTASTSEDVVASLADSTRMLQADFDDLMSEYREIQAALESLDVDFLLRKRIINKALADKFAAEVQATENPYYAVKSADEALPPMTIDSPEIAGLLTEKLDTSIRSLTHAKSTVQRDVGKSLRMLSGTLTLLADILALLIQEGEETALVRKAAFKVLRLAPRY